MKIEREPLTQQAFDEALPLGRACWKESTEAKGESCAYYGSRDFDPDPDKELYVGMDQAGMIVFVTLREEGRLRGYVVGILYRSMHNRHTLCALGDSIYVEPEYRSYTGPLAERFEKELTEAGVAIIGWPVHVKGPVYPVLKARGYTGDDLVMEKRLCAS